MPEVNRRILPTTAVTTPHIYWSYVGWLEDDEHWNEALKAALCQSPYKLIAMDKPELYNVSNGLQRRITLQYITEHTKNRKRNKVIGNKAIDLGCGDGSLSVIIRNIAPHSYKKFLACDINESMIKFANEHYAHEDISFSVLDMEGYIPENLIGEFDQVYSFFALHWVQNQERAFKNIYSLLVDDGDMFFILAGNTPIYTVYDILKDHPKWKSWLIEVDNKYISKYHKVEDPQKKIVNIMENCGFKNIDVQCKLRTSGFENLQEYKNFVQSLEPFKMPQEVFDEFFIDHCAMMEEFGFLKFNSHDSGLSFDHTIVIISANK